MIGHMRHGSSPRLLALQSILSPNRRESLPTPSAGARMRRIQDDAGHGTLGCEPDRNTGAERLAIEHDALRRDALREPAVSCARILTQPRFGRCSSRAGVTAVADD